MSDTTPLSSAVPRKPQALGDLEKDEVPNPKRSIFRRAISWIKPPRPEPEKSDTPKEHLHHADDSELPYTAAESREATAKLWTIYVGEAERYDKALVESWKADMEGMLIFSGLFSASLTAFIIESYRSLQQDPADSTVRLLARISDQLVALSSNTTFVPPTPPAFHPSSSSLVCNILWFLSLTLSLTCALLATLVEQWAREFLHKTEKRPSPVRRARVFAFLYFGLRRFGLHFVVDLIPLLLHIALVLFLTGLVAFLSPINHIMTGLIGASLGLFLILYAMITILPVVSLDCPYRTPFSAVVWNFLRGVRQQFHLSPSLTSNTIADAVVDMALVHSVKRDQLSLKWTLDSLTDDTEFLPFFEAIPEAIHGAKGFHLVNDHLFIPLLRASPNQRRLGDRITDFTAKCRNLDSKEPRRERGLIIGLKAIWALAMISGRDGEFFKHGQNFWFSPAHHSGLLSQSDDTTKGGYGANDPMEAFEVAASMAMRYTWFNNIRHQIAAVLGMAQGTVSRDSLLVEVAALLAKFKHYFYRPDSSPEFSSTQDALQKWCDDTEDGGVGDVAILLSSVMTEATWTAIYVTYLCLVLVYAADTTFLGGDLPYQFEQTYLKIIPSIPTPGSASRMSRRHIFSAPSFKYLDPSRYLNSPDQMLKLDRIMACLLRILPHLEPTDCMTTVILYLGNRNDAEALDLALKHCNSSYLVDCLTTILKANTDNSEILHCLRVVLVSSAYRRSVSSQWGKQDQVLYDFMASQSIFNDPKFLALSTVMRMQKLDDLRQDTFRLLRPLREPPYTPEKINMALAQQQTLMAHPLLLSDPGPLLPENTTVQQVIVNIEITTAHIMTVWMTQFLLGCVKDPDHVASGHTMNSLRHCFRRSVSDGVDSQVMVDFADACLALVGHLCQNPHNPRLIETADEWVKMLLSTKPLPDTNDYHDAVVDPLYEEALILYLDFLQGVGSKVKSAKLGIDRTTRALAGVRAFLSLTNEQNAT